MRKSGRAGRSQVKAKATVRAEKAEATLQGATGLLNVMKGRAEEAHALAAEAWRQVAAVAGALAAARALAERGDAEGAIAAVMGSAAGGALLAEHKRLMLRGEAAEALAAAVRGAEGAPNVEDALAAWDEACAPAGATEVADAAA